MSSPAILALSLPKRRLLVLVRDGAPLPRVPSTLFLLADLADAGLVQVERDERGGPIAWVLSPLGRVALGDK